VLDLWWVVTLNDGLHGERQREAWQGEQATAQCRTAGISNQLLEQYPT
jgi:hypothetical protein